MFVRMFIDADALKDNSDDFCVYFSRWFGSTRKSAGKATAWENLVLC